MEIQQQEQVYMFAGGPTMLPKSIKKKLREKMFPKTGLSSLQINSNSKQFNEILTKTKQNLRLLLNIPNQYKIWFCGGGAHLQFAGLPLNFLKDGTGCNYATTGYFSKLAYSEAKKCSNAHSIVNMQQDQSGKFTLPESYDYLPGASYTHFVDNETVQGLQYPDENFPYQADIPLIDDCSSSILTKPINWNKISMAYAHVQKNCGISGGNIIILKEQLINYKNKNIPSILNYSNYDSNYPQTLNFTTLYGHYLMTQYIKDNGGVSSQRYQKRSKKLYDVLESSKLYTTLTNKKYQSRINVTWRINKKELEQKCLDQGALNGLYQFKGHRTAGGFRASLFIPVPDQAISKLCDFLTQFSIKYE